MKIDPRYYKLSKLDKQRYLKEVVRWTFGEYEKIGGFPHVWLLCLISQIRHKYQDWSKHE